MDIIYYGAACFKLKGKQATVIIDPFDPDFTKLKLPKDLEANAVLVTHGHKDHANFQAVAGEPVLVQGPGEYEIKGVSVNGIPSYHDKTQGSERGRNTIYHINMEGLNIVHLGDLGHTLTQEQVEDIGVTDILMVPTGGVFTIDSKEAAEVVSQLEPRIIIPMHFGVGENAFNLEPVENFLKVRGLENIAPLPKLSITKEKLPEEPQVILLGS